MLVAVAPLMPPGDAWLHPSGPPEGRIEGAVRGALSDCKFAVCIRGFAFVQRDTWVKFSFPNCRAGFTDSSQSHRETGLGATLGIGELVAIVFDLRTTRELQAQICLKVAAAGGFATFNQVFLTS